MRFDTKAGEIAVYSLIREVEATPKPGLVDKNNTGSHTDMDLPLFIKSAEALHPYFEAFARYGEQTSFIPAKAAFPDSRKIGLEAERAMFKATGGVNTHKGAIFSLGLLCLSYGRLYGQNVQATLSSLCRTVSEYADGICTYDYNDMKRRATHGDLVYKKYGSTGPRGEAEDGFPTLRYVTYPAFERGIRSGLTENDALVYALISTMAMLDDTNVLNRAGRETLLYVKRRAEGLVGADPEKIKEFDRELIRLNVSPGGSADMIAQALFVYRITNKNSL